MIPENDWSEERRKISDYMEKIKELEKGETEREESWIEKKEHLENANFQTIEEMEETLQVKKERKRKIRK